MKEQNYKNHIRLLPFWHYTLVPLMLLASALAVWNMIRSWERVDNRLNAGLILLVVVIITCLYWYARLFALRAQDRAIRAEENFRHFILTGKPFDSRIRMGQIIALRFASDAEFVGLAERAVEEKMSSKEIKQSIVSWRADHNRV